MDRPHQTWSAPPWTIVLRADQGAVRKRMEDASCVALSTPVPGGRTHLLGVFDGLGGEPNGMEAAQAAASNLPEVVRRCVERGEILGRLNPFVLATGGATTAVLALLDPLTSAVDLHAVGDSSVYGVGPDGWAPLLPRDGQPPHRVTDFLGNRELVGHRAEHLVPPGGGLVLCTDGVDGVVEEGDLMHLLDVAAPDLGRAVDRLFEEIARRGAPDNATLCVVRRGPRPPSP